MEYTKTSERGKPGRRGAETKKRAMQPMNGGIEQYAYQTITGLRVARKDKWMDMLTRQAVPMIKR